MQLEKAVVVIDDFAIGRKTSVVIEAAFRARPQALQWGGAIVTVGRSVGLEIVDADFLSFMHRPAGLSEDRRHVATCTIGFAGEHDRTTFCADAIETARGRRGRR